MKFVISIVALVPFLVFGQVQDHFSDYQILDSTQTKMGLRIQAFNNSTALTAHVLNRVFYGGRIDNQEKEFMLERADPINNSGSTLSSSIYFSRKIDSINGQQKNGLHYFVNIANRQENLAVFTDKALQLILNGNKQFAGQTISLDPIYFNSLSYSQAQIGFGKNFKSGNGLSVGLSFLYGHSNIHGTADRFDLIHSEYGDRISVDAELDLYETEQTNNLMAYNGAGASMDVQGRFNIHLLPDSNNPGMFSFSISDLGFIHWNANSSITKVDTFYSYQGQNVENVLDLGSQISGSPGDIWDSVSTKERGSFTLYTPTTIHFYLSQKINKMEFAIGGAHRTLAYYLPYFYGKFGYRIKPFLVLGGQINYGGYGKLGAGIELLIDKPNYLLKCGSTNLEGFISPERWGGQSIYIQAALKL